MALRFFTRARRPSPFPCRTIHLRSGWGPIRRRTPSSAIAACRFGSSSKISHGFFHPAFRARPVKHVHHVAEILFVADAVRGLRREFNLRAEVRGQFPE